MDFKQLDRFRQKTRLKIQLTSYMNQVFLELQYFFKSVLHQKAVYALLKDEPTPQDISPMHMTHLSQAVADMRLTALLKAVFPGDWEHILTCAYYLVSEGSALAHVEKCKQAFRSPYSGKLSS